MGRIGPEPVGEITGLGGRNGLGFVDNSEGLGARLALDRPSVAGVLGLPRRVPTLFGKPPYITNLGTAPDRPYYLLALNFNANLLCSIRFVTNLI